MKMQKRSGGKAPRIVNLWIGLRVP